MKLATVRDNLDTYNGNIIVKLAMKKKMLANLC